MGESFLITLREGFEAALIVAIVLAFVRRSARPEMARAVWLGAFAAIGLSVVAGLVLHVTVDGLEGVARARTFAAICIGAAALLTWMIFWMRTHSRHLKRHLEGRASAALVEQSAVGLAMVAFLAVAREGLETALFLISSTSASSPGDVAVGGVLGLAVAVLLGVAVYHGSSRFPMRRFFQVTGALIILFAAGLVAKSVLFLQGAGDLGTINDAVYDLTSHAWLTNSTQSGRFLAGIFGWDPRPSFEQVVAYVAFLVPALVFFFWEGKAPKSPVVPPADVVPAVADRADERSAQQPPARV